MKLRSILNEVKLIPHNRILLKRDDSHPFLYFTVGNFEFNIFSSELSGGEASWDIKFVDILKPFFDSKRIKYITNKNSIYVYAKYFITPDKINENISNKKHIINYEYYNKLLGISNQYKTQYIKKVLDSIHNNQNDIATQRQYDLLKKFADGYGDNDKYSYSTKNEVKILKNNFVYVNNDMTWLSDSEIVFYKDYTQGYCYSTYFLPIKKILLLKNYLKSQDIPFTYVGGFGEGKIENIPLKYIKKLN